MLYLIALFSVGFLVETTSLARGPPPSDLVAQRLQPGSGAVVGSVGTRREALVPPRGSSHRPPDNLHRLRPRVCAAHTAARLVRLNTFVPLTHQVLRLWERSMVLEDLIHRYFEDLVLVGVHLSTRKIRSALERSGASILGPSTAPWRQLWPSAREE